MFMGKNEISQVILTVGVVFWPFPLIGRKQEKETSLREWKGYILSCKTVLAFSLVVYFSKLDSDTLILRVVEPFQSVLGK